MNKQTVSGQEIDAAVELLKRIADNRADWTQEQQDTYKVIADYAEEQMQGTHYTEI